MYHVLLFAALGAATIEPPADSSELNFDTLSVRYAANNVRPIEHSLDYIYSLSSAIYRAKRIKVFVLPIYQRPSQDEIREKRLHELKKILTQEGAADHIVEEATLDEKKASILLRQEPDLFCLVTIESIPYLRNSMSRAGSLQQAQLVNFDTLVYLSSGIPISIDYRTYLLSERLPEIEALPRNDLRQMTVKDEFEVLGDYAVNSGKLSKYSFMVPVPTGKSERQMLVYRSDSSGKTWKQIKHKGRMTVGKTIALCIPVEGNGIYRVGYSSRVKDQAYVLCMPKMMGVTFAELSRDDGIQLPVKIVMGGTAMAFQIADAPDRYLLHLKAMRSDGRLVEQSAIPLKACLTNKTSDSKLSSHSSLRELQGFIVPELKYIVPSDLFHDNLVNR